MKRFVLFVICFILIWAAGAPAALANTWGLSGDLLRAVSSVSTWNDYSTLCKQAGDFALMRSRYHNVLMVIGAENQELSVYTKAVYQPGDTRGDDAALSLTGDGFTLAYGGAERYTFYLDDGIYALKDAVIGGFSVALTDPNDKYGYIVSDGAESAVIRQHITLSSFNIRLFPHSVDEARHLNFMRAALDSGKYCLGFSVYPDDMPDHTRRSNIADGTEPVYSAPFGNSAWRAANGKAAVGLQGELWTQGVFYIPDGSAWACIRYNVSQRTQRIGYIPASVLGFGKLADSGWNAYDYLLSVEVRADHETFLTDDPDVSQYPQFTVPEGTALTCLGLYGDTYAYVSAEVKGERFTDGGAVIWGFVPLRALSFPAGDPWRGAQQPDVMQTMIGDWVYTEGGTMADAEITFHGDGTFTAWYFETDLEMTRSSRSGKWSVTKYNPDWNLYWSNPPYELTLIYDDGRVNIKGLSFFDQGFSLTNNEGGGGYTRPENKQ